MESNGQNQHRIGIVGGMGPMAGVLLQKLIIEATPATKDQDHLQVICFTNPQIPDRTVSLRRDNGVSYLNTVIETAHCLCQAGATMLVIPCNTAHARFSELQSAVPVPIINMVEVTAAAIARQYGSDSTVGILATDGALQVRLYQRALERYGIECIVPSEHAQQNVMQSIYTIKAGKLVESATAFNPVIDELVRRGAHRILLGCTELSLCFEEIQRIGYSVIDPLRIVARHLVENRHQPFESKNAFGRQATRAMSLFGCVVTIVAGGVTL